MKRLVGIKDVAAALSVKPSTVYDMVSRRQIPFVKVGRLTKFNPDAIEAWITQHSFSPLRPPGASRKPSRTSPLDSSNHF